MLKVKIYFTLMRDSGKPETLKITVKDGGEFIDLYVSGDELASLREVLGD